MEEKRRKVFPSKEEYFIADRDNNQLLMKFFPEKKLCSMIELKDIGLYDFYVFF